MEELKEELKTHSIINKPNINLTVDELVEELNEALDKTANKLCPETTKNVRYRPNQKWFSSKLLALKRAWYRARRKCRKNKTDENKQNVKEARSSYENAMIRYRCYHYSNKVEKSDTKNLFKTLNYLSGEDNSTILPSSNNDKALANKINNFFADKVIGIRGDVTAEQKSSDHLSMSHDNNDDDLKCSLNTFDEIDLNTLETLIKDMNTKFNPEDPLPTAVFKKCLDVLGPVVLLIVNKSLAHSVFPSSLKTASIRPTIKDRNGDKESLKNYRPISNTPFLSKILEKVALDQINSYISSNDLHSQYQSGYRKHHSCETAVLKLTDDILKSFRGKKMCCLVLLDMSAAFDTVDHDLLLSTLQNNYNIDGSVLKWLASYLNNRRFAVTVGTTKADEILMLYGVPQGSLLGPLLFILYTKEVARIALRYGLRIQLYADDTQLYLAFDPLEDFDDMEQRFAQCMEDIKIWMRSHFLKLNIEKTDIMFFGSRYSTSMHCFNSLELGDKEPTCRTTEGFVKTLGVRLDENLTMKHHINNIIQVGNYHLKRFHRLRYYLDYNTKLKIVTAFVLTKVDYCNSLLANVPKKAILRLQKLINSCVRFLFNLRKREHVSVYAKQAHILPIAFRIKYKLCTIVHKIINGRAPPYLSDLICPKIIHRSNLRSENDFFMMQPQSPSCDISFKMTLAWNELPYDIRCLSDDEKFKKELKTLYFLEAYQNV